MFFLSLMLFAWLVFDWHAAVPMMIAMCFGAYGARLPWRADSTPVAKCALPHHMRNTCLIPALTHCSSSNADMYHYALRLIGKFHLRADEMVTGKFDVSR